MKNHLIYNGSLIPEDELRISPLNRGMMYGDGCFDTLRSYKGKFLKLEEHFNRFIDGANYIGIKAPFGFEDFKYKILELLEANQMMDKDAIIRVQCWRDGVRGYATNSSNGNWVTTCSPFLPYKAVIRLETVNTSAIPSEALERKFKLSNGLNYIQAAREAMESGSDDALMLTMNGKISETTNANIFWIHDKTVFTPSIDCDLFPGITRSIVINLLKAEIDMNFEEASFEYEHILGSEAAFVTNSVREIRPINFIDQTKLDVIHPVVQKIRVLFQDYKNDQLC